AQEWRSTGLGAGTALRGHRLGSGSGARLRPWKPWQCMTTVLARRCTPGAFLQSPASCRQVTSRNGTGRIGLALARESMDPLNPWLYTMMELARNCTSVAHSPRPEAFPHQESQHGTAASGTPSAAE